MARSHRFNDAQRVPLRALDTPSRLSPCRPGEREPVHRNPWAHAARVERPAGPPADAHGSMVAAHLDQTITDECREGHAPRPRPVGAGGGPGCVRRSCRIHPDSVNTSGILHPSRCCWDIDQPEWHGQQDRCIHPRRRRNRNRTRHSYRRRIYNLTPPPQFVSMADSPRCAATRSSRSTRLFQLVTAAGTGGGRACSRSYTMVRSPSGEPRVISAAGWLVR